MMVGKIAIASLFKHHIKKGMVERR